MSNMNYSTFDIVTGNKYSGAIKGNYRFLTIFVLRYNEEISIERITENLVSNLANLGGFVKIVFVSFCILLYFY